MKALSCIDSICQCLRGLGDCLRGMMSHVLYKNNPLENKSFQQLSVICGKVFEKQV